MHAITNQMIAALPVGKKRADHDSSETVRSKKQRTLNQRETAAVETLATLRNPVAQIPRRFYPVWPGSPLVHFRRGGTVAGTFSACSKEGFFEKKGGFALMYPHAAVQWLSLSLPPKINNMYLVFLLNKTALSILGLFSPFEDKGLKGAYFLEGPLENETKTLRVSENKKRIFDAIVEMGQSFGTQSLEELGKRFLPHIKIKKERTRKLRAYFSAIAIAVKALKEGSELSETAWVEIYTVLHPWRPRKEEFRFYLQAAQGYESIFINWFVQDQRIRALRSEQDNFRALQRAKTQRNIEIIQGLIKDFLSMDKKDIDQTGFQQLAQKIEHQKRGMKAVQLKRIFSYIAKALEMGLTDTITNRDFEVIKQENADINRAVINKAHLQTLLDVAQKRGAEFQERFGIVKLITF